MEFSDVPEDSGGVVEETFSSPVHFADRDQLYSFVFGREFQCVEFLPVAGDIVDFEE